MKISELLQENELPRPPKSALPSAASINDQPEDDLDDEEIDGSEDNQDAIDAFKDVAKNLGNGLYVTSMYDYGDDFTRAYSDSSVVSAIEGIGGPSADVYLRQNDSDVLNLHRVSAFYLNEENGESFAVFIDEDGVSWTGGSLDGLVSADIITTSQAAQLLKVQDRGELYAEQLSRTDWRGGEVADDEAIYNRLDSLIGALRLPDTGAPSGGGPSAERDKIRSWQKSAEPDMEKQVFALLKAKEQRAKAVRAKR